MGGRQCREADGHIFPDQNVHLHGVTDSMLSTATLTGPRRMPLTARQSSVWVEAFLGQRSSRLSQRVMNDTCRGVESERLASFSAKSVRDAIEFLLREARQIRASRHVLPQQVVRASLSGALRIVEVDLHIRHRRDGRGRAPATGQSSPRGGGPTPQTPGGWDCRPTRCRRRGRGSARARGC